MRIIPGIIAAVALCADPYLAHAQSTSKTVVAEQLFQEGRVLMASEDFKEAVLKLQASLEVDRSSGTLGSLGVCYERLDMLASAWVHYREASALAERQGNADRAKAASAAAAALEPRLPRLTIMAPADAIPELVIERGGDALTSTTLGTAIYVDPGEHEITATAPGFQPFSHTVEIAEGESLMVEIPTLTPLREPAPAEEAVTARGAAQGQQVTQALPSAADDTRDVKEPGRRQRIAGLMTGGLGATVLTTGLIVGATVFSAWEKPFDSDECDRDTLVCTPEGQSRTETARGRANLSNVLVGIGAAAAVTGAVLYFAAPSRRPAPRDAAHVTPIVSSDMFGISVRGGF